MANLALVTASTSHAAYTTTKSALESAGHTVTGFNMSAVTSTNLAAFDAIVCARCLTSDPGYAAFVPLLKSYSNTGHKPVLVGYDAASAGSNITVGLPIELKLAQKLTAEGTASINIRANTPHPVWSAIPISTPSDVQVITAAAFGVKVDATGSVSGTTIGVVSSGDSSPTVVVAEAGQVLIGGTTFGSKLAFAGFLYGGSTYTANGIAILDSLIDWLLALPAQIIGTVKDDTDAPLARTVRAYQRNTGAFVGSAVSSAVDGSFTINVPNGTELHYVIALDELAGEKNAIVKDRVMPYMA